MSQGAGACRSSPDCDVTQLLEEWSRGNDEALERLVPLVYDQLRALAASYMRREQNHHTLQPTALIHETFLRLVGQSSVVWRSRKQFFAVAARSMRQVLVDYAREKASRKRGSAAVKISLSLCGDDVPAEPRSATTREADLLCDVVAVDTVLEELAELDSELSRLVELRFFAGFTIAETASAMAISTATVKRGWATARAWLFDRLRTSP